MKEPETNASRPRVGLPHWLLAIIYFVLMIGFQSQAGALYKSILGHAVIFIWSVLFGGYAIPGSWNFSIFSEVFAFPNPGLLTGFWVGNHEGHERSLFRGTFPNLICAGFLLIVTFVIPHGVWLSFLFGPVVLCTLPYSVLGAWIGRKVRLRFGSIEANLFPQKTRESN